MDQDANMEIGKDINIKNKSSPIIPVSVGRRMMGMMDVPLDSGVLSGGL